MYKHARSEHPYKLNVGDVILKNDRTKSPLFLVKIPQAGVEVFCRDSFLYDPHGMIDKYGNDMILWEVVKEYVTEEELKEMEAIDRATPFK